MISYLTHHKIDKSKWDEVISKSYNNLIYGYSWYLDIISPGWDAVIYGNYSAILPLTRKKKFGISYLVQPKFCQQIRIFSEVNNDQLWPDFLKLIRKKFIYINICCSGDKDHFQNYPIIIPHTNLFLNLKKTYSELNKDYSKSNSKNIRRAIRHEIEVKKCKPEIALEFLKSEYKKILADLPLSDFDLYDKLMQQAFKKTNMYCLAAYSNNEILAVTSLLVAKKRIHTLMVASQNGKEKSALFYLIDRLIEEQSGTDCSIDFSGSDVESIAYFFSGFGTQSEKYYQIKYWRLIPSFFYK
jgi:hypothetical protein